MHTSITEIVAPTSAAPGEAVSVSFRVNNLGDGLLHVYVVAIIEETGHRFILYDTWLEPLGSQVFNGSFEMPSHAVTTLASSWYEDEYGYLHPNDEARRVISLVSVAEFSGFGITEYTKR